MLATDRPRFKQELVAEPIEDGGARFIDLMDPDSGNIFGTGVYRILVR